LTRTGGGGYESAAYIYSPTVDSEVVLIFEHNNVDLKKLSSFV
jgi:hypothetical protein